MNVTFEKLGELTANLKVSVSPEDYGDNFISAVSEYARKASMKGFRPGKVPKGLVRKMYGKALLLEEINKVLSKGLEDYITDEKLDLLGGPIPQPIEDLDLDTSELKSFDFDYKVGLKPDVEIKWEGEGLDLPPQYTIEVDDAYLQMETEKLLSRYGDMENPDVFDEGDSLFGRLVLVEGEEAKFPEGWTPSVELSKLVSLNPKDVPVKKVAKMFLGTKKDDIIPNLLLKQVFESPAAIKKFWEHDVSSKKVASLTEDDEKNIAGLKFNLEVKKINRIIPAVPGEELYAKLFGPDSVKDEAEFKTRLEKDFAKFLAEDGEKYFRAKAQKYLMDLNSFPLPDDFMKEWLIHSSDKLTPEVLENLYEPYTRDLSWSLIVGKIRKENPDVKVEWSELEDAMKVRLEEQMGPGFKEQDEEKISEILGYLLKDEKNRNQLEEELFERKLFAEIKKHVPVLEEKITASDYLKLGE